MSLIDHYFQRFFYPLPTIQEPPPGLLSYIAVIPVYNEELLTDTLNSLHRTEVPFGKAVEILLIFNRPGNDSPGNKVLCERQFQQAKTWCCAHSTPQRGFQAIDAGDLPQKHAGPGLARKIGMDLALQRFNLRNNPQGFILSLDADTWVESNYFTALDEHLHKNPSTQLCLYHFEHPLCGHEFPEKVYQAVIQYELHLRYYKHILQQTGFPYANYTLGSGFGVRADVYALHGGMNRKKAGEDFYFLNKLFPHVKVANLATSCVTPSPRPSGRVVFGTGPVIRELMQMNQAEYLTYHPAAFNDLKIFFGLIPEFYQSYRIESSIALLPVSLQHFLQEDSFSDKIQEIKANTSHVEAFIKRFYLWFDGFRVVKYLNHCHSSLYTKVPVVQACLQVFPTLGLEARSSKAGALLNALRERDRIS